MSHVKCLRSAEVATHNSNAVAILAEEEDDDEAEDEEEAAEITTATEVATEDSVGTDATVVAGQHRNVQWNTLPLLQHVPQTQSRRPIWSLQHHQALSFNRTFSKLLKSIVSLHGNVWFVSLPLLFELSKHLRASAFAPERQIMLLTVAT